MNTRAEEYLHLCEGFKLGSLGAGKKKFKYELEEPDAEDQPSQQPPNEGGKQIFDFGSKPDMVSWCERMLPEYEEVFRLKGDKTTGFLTFYLQPVKEADKTITPVMVVFVSFKSKRHLVGAYEHTSLHFKKKRDYDVWLGTNLKGLKEHGASIMRLKTDWKKRK